MSQAVTLYVLLLHVEVKVSILVVQTATKHCVLSNHHGAVMTCVA